MVVNRGFYSSTEYRDQGSQEIKPLQNKKGQKNLGYPRKKQSFSLEKDCFFVGYLKFFWPFLFWNGFSDLKNFENSRPSASNFKCFSPSLEHFFLTVDQNNFGNKIPFLLTVQVHLGGGLRGSYEKNQLTPEGQEQLWSWPLVLINLVHYSTDSSWGYS